MASRGKAGTTRPDDVPDEVWAEAVRRAVVAAPLAREDLTLGVATLSLALERPSVNRLLLVNAT